MPENIYNPDFKSAEACQIPGLEWIYCGVFGIRRDGTFVEVGAHDGKSWSNTHCLTEVGWSGLYIEPVEHLYNRCVENHKNHPGVQVIRAMVGEGDQKTLYRNPSYDYLYTGNKEFAMLNQATGIYAELQTVQLDDILRDRNIPVGFDLLVIDVEGMEVEVLNGFSCTVWRPTMVIIETHELNPNAEMAERTAFIEEYFLSRDYTKIYTSAINTIYILV